MCSGLSLSFSSLEESIESFNAEEETDLDALEDLSLDYLFVNETDEDQSGSLSFLFEDNNNRYEEDSDNSERSEENLRNISEELLKPLYKESDLTILDSLLLLLQYSVRHSLTKKAFSELLVLTEAHLPEKNIGSSYKVNKYFTELFCECRLKE